MCLPIRLPLRLPIVLPPRAEQPVTATVTAQISQFPLLFYIVGNAFINRSRCSLKLPDQQEKLPLSEGSRTWQSQQVFPPIDYLSR